MNSFTILRENLCWKHAGDTDVLTETGNILHAIWIAIKYK